MFEYAGSAPGEREAAPTAFGRPGSYYPGPTWRPELARLADPGPISASPVAPTPSSEDGGPSPREARLEAEEEIMALASKIASAHGRIVEILTEHGEDLSGPDDLSRWLSWAAGMKPTTAKATVRLAESAERLPRITGALSKGEISFDKAATIARVATPETEETLVEWAKTGAVSQLTSITSGYLKAKASDDGRDGAHLRRHLSYFFTEDGAFRLRAQMSADQGAVVVRAIDAAADALFEEQKSFAEQELSESDQAQQDYTYSDHHGPRQADALVSLAEAFLAHGLADDTSGERFRVLVHVDQAALQGEANATSELEDGVGISHETALRLACDCRIQALLQDDGAPLKLGRERRVVSPALRRALQARDRCCVFHGCSARRRLDAHHVKHWVRDGGETEPENVSLLCRRHHRLLHEGGYDMTFDGRVARFFRPDGSEIERAPTWKTVTEAERHEWCAREDLDYDTWAHWIDDFDLNEAVAYLLREDPERHPPPETPASERHPPPETPAPERRPPAEIRTAV